MFVCGQIEACCSPRDCKGSDTTERLNKRGPLNEMRASIARLPSNQEAGSAHSYPSCFGTEESFTSKVSAFLYHLLGREDSILGGGGGQVQLLYNAVLVSAM